MAPPGRTAFLVWVSFPLWQSVREKHTEQLPRFVVTFLSMDDAERGMDCLGRDRS
jgi:hypothetical protein